MKVIGEGFKRADVSVDIQPLTLITGPNASGKSTVAEVIRFTSLGYIPTLGKRPMDTAAIVRGRSARGELHLDTGQIITRTITNEKNGYTTKTHCSWLTRAKPSEHSQAAIGLFGDEEIDVAEAMDIRQLLNASPNRRAARIQKMLTSTSGEAYIEMVAKLTTQRLVDVEDRHVPSDWRIMQKSFTPHQLASVKSIFPKVKAQMVSSGLAGAHAYVVEQKNIAAQEAHRMKLAGQEIQTRLKELENLGEYDVSILERERSAIERDLGAARERVSQADRLRTSITEATDALARAKMDLELAKTERDAFQQMESSAKERAETLATIEGKLATLEAPQPVTDPELDTLEERENQLSVEADELLNSLPEVPKTSAEVDALERLSRQLDELEHSDWIRIRTLTNSVQKALGKQKVAEKVQPFLEEIRTIVSERQEGDPGTLRNAIEEKTATIASLQKEASEITAQREEMIVQHGKMLDELTELKAQIGTIRDKRAMEHRAALSEYETEKQQLTAARDRERQAFSAIKQRDKRSAAALNDAESRVREAEQRIAAYEETESAPTAEALATLEQQLSQTRERLSHMTNVKATRTELKRIEDACEAATVASSVWSAFDYALKAARSKEITDAGGPLVAAMHQFLDGAGRTETPYFRAGKDVCEVGWTNDGIDIPIQALSGGEYVLFAAALTAAVMILRKAHLRILLIEAAECDPERLSELLDGIKSVSKDLTHAIVMSAHAPTRVDEDWLVIESPSAAASAAA